MPNDLETLREEVAYLRSELALDTDLEFCFAFRKRFGVRPMCARLLEALYQRGRILSHERLVELIGSTDECGKTISVLVYHIRKALGDDAIITALGLGVRIGPAGVAAVETVLADMRRVTPVLPRRAKVA